MLAVGRPQHLPHKLRGTAVPVEHVQGDAGVQGVHLVQVQEVPDGQVVVVRCRCTPGASRRQV